MLSLHLFFTSFSLTTLSFSFSGRKIGGGGTPWQLLEHLQSGVLTYPPVSCLLRRVTRLTGSRHVLQRHVFDVVVSLTERAASSVEATFTLWTAFSAPVTASHYTLAAMQSTLIQRWQYGINQPCWKCNGYVLCSQLAFLKAAACVSIFSAKNAE